MNRDKFISCLNTVSKNLDMNWIFNILKNLYTPIYMMGIQKGTETLLLLWKNSLS